MVITKGKKQAIEDRRDDHMLHLLAPGSDTGYEFDTLALHAGAVPDPTTGAMITPIYQTTTYRQEAVGQDKGFTYSRSGNPTVSALERRLAALEGAEFCTCYGTGLAATTALCLALLRSGGGWFVRRPFMVAPCACFRAYAVCFHRDAGESNPETY